MNRFVKHNMLLVAVFAVSGAVAVALMIFALIEYVQMASVLDTIDKLRDDIVTIGKQTPKPVDENKPRIASDIELYRKSSAELRSHFGRPMQPAVDAFIAAIRPEIPPAPPKKKEGEEGEEVKAPEVLTEATFIAKFHEGWDQIPATQYPQQNYFLDSKFRPNYPNWKKGTEAFAALAKEHTFEVINTNNVDEILLSAMGIPRHLQGRPEELQRIFNEFRQRVNEALDGKIDLTEQANRFGFPSDAAGSYAVADYPILLDHMNIIHDMLIRLKEPNDPKNPKEPLLKVIHDIRIRNGAANEGWKGSVEGSGSFSVYHYTIVATGPMEAIRDVAVKLANAYKDRRIYIVRSVFLYAEENRAASLFTLTESSESETKTPQKKDETSSAAPVRGRRRGGRAAVAPATAAEDQAKAAEEAAKKKREDAERMKEFLRRQAGLPVEKRYGYGEILIGGSRDFRAVFDIDYVVLNR